MTMARSSDPLPEDEIWGTWEELLLACAVNRHGAHSWDSVADEVRSRSPYANLLTADNCKHRYRLLKRRFASGGGGGEGINGGDEIDGEEPTVEIPWLDELRKLRVAELRREVQRYDVSIGSLQQKVKRLKEERGRSLGEPEGGDAVNGSGAGRGSDLKEKDDQQDDRIESPRYKPENAAGDRTSGEYSGGSCKESNSTEPNAEREVKVDARIEEEASPAVNGSRSGSRSHPVVGAEASYNGSSDTIAKGAVRSSAVEQNQALHESGESVAESKGGENEEGAKQSSDVQSSASLSRRPRRRRRRRAGASAASEQEAEACSAKGVEAESQPLIAFLDTIRSNKDGSVFARRLESQEGVRYRSLIRRHVDLEMVRNRIGRNGYASGEFFRDLLLLCNNALVFHSKGSPESISAVHIRDLINKEIAVTLRKPPQHSPQSAKELTPPPAAATPAQVALPPPPSKPKSDPGRANSSLEKPASLPSIVACRKRSSIPVKPAKPGKKAENVVKEEKKAIERKEIEEEAEEEEGEEEEEEEEEEEDRDTMADKKRTKQKTTVSRGLRTSKTRGNISKGGGGEGGAAVAKNLKPEPVAAAQPDPAEQEAKSGGPSTAKKRSAADFLNRMKSSSPSPNGKTIEMMKSASSSQKRKMKVESKMGSSASAAAAAGKKSVGRPPKRAAAIPVPPSKRAREEKTPPLPKKRGRR